MTAPYEWEMPSTSLRLGDAVGAIVLVDGARYLMQLRDSRPDIWFPGHWGTFGGAIDPGESELDALRRELKEELDFDAVDDAERFGSLAFDLTPMGYSKCVRTYFVLKVSAETASRFVLGEGADMRAFAPAELFAQRLAPYDGFALYLHASLPKIAR